MRKWTFEERLRGALILLLFSFIGFVILILTGVVPWEGSLDELRPR